MITSSNFFDKQFFTLEELEHKIQSDELSPWESSIHSKIMDKKSEQQIPSQQISQHSPSVLLYQKRNIQKSSSNLKNEKKQRKLSPLRNRFKKDNQFNYLGKYDKSNYFSKQKSFQIDPSEVLQRKKSNYLFPAISIGQYKQLKARGNGIEINGSIDFMLEKRKNRKKKLEQNSHRNSEFLHQRKSGERQMNKQRRQVFSGRYVCAIKTPQQLQLERLISQRVMETL